EKEAAQDTRPAAGLRRVEHVMGMPVGLHLADPLPAEILASLADGVFAWLRDVDERFSTDKVDSEVSRPGRGEVGREDRSADVGYVLDRCAELWRATDGYFDAYASGKLDPSGYVKGWAVQVASDRLRAGGSANHWLNAGGDISLRGGPSPGAPWRIGI